MVLRKLVALNIALSLWGTGGVVNEPLQVEEVPTIHSALEGVHKQRALLQEELKLVLSEPHKKIQIELVGVDDKGQYWLDKNAEYEPIIFVENKFAEHWGVEDYELGNKVVGVFDSEGWELLAVQK